MIDEFGIGLVSQSQRSAFGRGGKRYRPTVDRVTLRIFGVHN